MSGGDDARRRGGCTHQTRLHPIQFKFTYFHTDNCPHPNTSSLLEFFRTAHLSTQPDLKASVGPVDLVNCLVVAAAAVAAGRCRRSHRRLERASWWRQLADLVADPHVRHPAVGRALEGGGACNEWAGVSRHGLGRVLPSRRASSRPRRWWRRRVEACPALPRQPSSGACGSGRRDGRHGRGFPVVRVERCGGGRGSGQGRSVEGRGGEQRRVSVGWTDSWWEISTLTGAGRGSARSRVPPPARLDGDRGVGLDGDRVVGLDGDRGVGWGGGRRTNPPTGCAPRLGRRGGRCPRRRRMLAAPPLRPLSPSMTPTTGASCVASLLPLFALHPVL